MDIIITESQLKMLEAYVTPPEMKERIKGVEAEKEMLEYYIEKHGEYMMDVTNGKTYLVQYLKALSDLVGKPYAVCAPVRNDGTYGAFYVKPYGSFKKFNSTVPNKATGQVKRKPNMYQQMGLNK